MKMLSQFGKTEPSKGKQGNVIKVRKRKKSFLEYFRCLSCKCRKGDSEQHSNVFTTRTNNSKPLGIPWDSDENVRRHVVEIKNARKLSVDSNHTFSSSRTTRPTSLERQISASVPDLRVNPCSVQAKPILKHKNNNNNVRQQKPKAKKRARFSEEVSVFLCEFNKVIKDQLKQEPDYVKSSGESTASRDIISATRAQQVFKLDSIEIERKGAHARKILRVIIHIGDSGVREKVTVCSARGGTRLVLTASRCEPLGDGTFYRRQLADKFRLPHPIDPCSLRAKVSPYGDLVIEATMFDFDDERSG